MKLYQKLIMALVLLASFGAGWFVEWWNSPLGVPLCAVSGAAYAARWVSPEYMTFWGIVFAAGFMLAVAAIVPLWIIALKKGGGS